MWQRKIIIVLGLCLVVASAVSAQQEKWYELNQKAMRLRPAGEIR